MCNFKFFVTEFPISVRETWSRFETGIDFEKSSTLHRHENDETETYWFFSKHLMILTFVPVF